MVSREGLYVMVIIIWLMGPCGMRQNQHDIEDRLERIEQAVGVAPTAIE